MYVPCGLKISKSFGYGTVLLPGHESILGSQSVGMLMLGRLGLPPKRCESNDLHDGPCFLERIIQKWLGRLKEVSMHHDASDFETSRNIWKRAACASDASDAPTASDASEQPQIEGWTTI